MAADSSYNIPYIVGYSLLVYVIASAVQNVAYNLFRHPLKHIPGPNLAAATFLYQTYFSLVGGSRYYVQIGKLHEKYGQPKRAERSIDLLILCSSDRTCRPNYTRRSSLE